MSYRIGIYPSGRLFLENVQDEGDVESDGLSQSLLDRLQDPFAQSTGDAILALTVHTARAAVPPSFVYWRTFGERFFHEVCHLIEVNDVDQWRRIGPPTELELLRIIAEAPPMRGSEYLSHAILQSAWHELREVAISQAQAHPEGPAAYLKGINPLWNQLGRVTFHLAENKRDAVRPFAFLATYAHRLTSASKLQHLPLGQAMQEYSGSGQKERLAALLEPVRRAAETSTLVRELLDTRGLFAPQAWTIQDAYRFLKEVPTLELAGLAVRVPNWWNPQRPTRPEVQVRVGEGTGPQMGAAALLDFSVDLALEGDPLSADERQHILNANEGLVLLRGRWVEVDRQKLKQALDHWQNVAAEHPDGITFVKSMHLLAGSPLSEVAHDAPAPDWSRMVAGDWLRDTLATLRDPHGLPRVQPGIDLCAELRPYQADGVRWLWFIVQLGLGGCLADDMGLGKTIQIIDLLLQLRRDMQANGANGTNPYRASLIVVPASLIGNWKQEIHKFAPSLRARFAHRSEMSAEDLDRLAKDPEGGLADVDVVVTSYGLARSSTWLAKVNWLLVILDEAQAIKNATSSQAKAVRKLAAHVKLILTGTPVENHLGDLWSLFDVCCPGLLGTSKRFKEFVKNIAKSQDNRGYGALRQLVRPYILRRLKTDPKVISDLPEKTEMRTDCGLSKRQAVLYEKAVKQLAKLLDEADGIARRGIVLSTLSQLKQICNHPAQYLNEPHFDPDDSGKFQRLSNICEPIQERQEKVLVFTQFQTLCDPLAEYLTTIFGRSGLVLHGQTPVKRRTELVRQFQQEQGPPFFVISLKAGGSGLNLTAASHVIHFDRWWNPAVENQATDRAFRIGQKKNVLVHKFVCRGTLEERIDAMIASKRELADQVLQQGGEVALTELSDEQLLEFVSLDLTRTSLE